MIERIAMKLEKSVVRLFAFSALAFTFAASARAGEVPPAAQEMAKTFGLDSWDKIEGLRYTWNAELPGAEKPFDGGAGTITISHKWEWEPTTARVSSEAKDGNGAPANWHHKR